MSEKKAFEIEVYVALKKIDKNYKWLANQLEISQPYLTDIVKGRRSPRKKIAEINNLLAIGSDRR